MAIAGKVLVRNITQQQGKSYFIMNPRPLLCLLLGVVCFVFAVLVHLYGRGTLIRIFTGVQTFRRNSRAGLKTRPAAALQEIVLPAARTFHPKHFFACPFLQIWYNDVKLSGDAGEGGALS